MFELITLGAVGYPRPTVDVGQLAECLLFYRKVHVITEQSTFTSLVRTCGADELLELCNMGTLEIEFVENSPMTLSVETNVGQCHDIGLVTANPMRFLQVARKVADEEGGASGRGASRLYKRFERTVSRSEYDKEMIRGPQDDMMNRDFLEDAVKKALAYLVPEYTLPTTIQFEPHKVPGRGVRYDTNIDFAEVNKHFHRRVSDKDASITPAYLLAHIAHAEPDIRMAAGAGSEFALDPLKSRIVSSKLEDIVRRSTKGQEKIASFQDVIVEGSRSVREAVNSGDRGLKDVIRLVEKSQKFKDWLQKQPDDETSLREEYLKSVASTDWADALPTKSVRFAVMTGLGVGAGLLLSPLAGVATGAALNAADAFLLDKLIKGWKPNQFVEGSLRAFLKEE